MVTEEYGWWWRRQQWWWWFVCGGGRRTWLRRLNRVCLTWHNGYSSLPSLLNRRFSSSIALSVSLSFSVCVCCSVLVYISVVGAGEEVGSSEEGDYHCRCLAGMEIPFRFCRFSSVISHLMTKITIHNSAGNSSLNLIENRPSAIWDCIECIGDAGDAAGHGGAATAVHVAVLQNS